ncbi:class I SAM-dependent methyltransferase [Leifsonia sp. YIM 134122]|uniref:Class I SAM-dependent methyltransferase n=1 Tax=Leifsonia stereocauli TaxID=3134136 RepID=A0ABU9W2U3_9MICO
MSEDRIDQTRRLYATVAHTYAEVLPDTRYEAPLELGMVDHFIAQLPDSELPVLDAGCGTGRMLHYLSTRGVSPVVGIDLSPEMIAHARTGHPGVALETGDLRALPYPDASIRAVLCWYAIIHSDTADVVAIVDEVGRVLMPGGTVLFGFQAGTGERVVEEAYGHDVTLHGVLHETPEIAHWLNEAGFDVTAIADRGPVGFERNSQGFVLARRR